MANINFISIIKGDSKGEQDGKLVVSSTPDPEGFSLPTVRVGTIDLPIDAAVAQLRHDSGMVVLAWQ